MSATDAELEVPAGPSRADTIRRLGDALHEFQQIAVDVLQSRRKSAKVVVELHLDDGAIHQPAQVMTKYSAGR